MELYTADFETNNNLDDCRVWAFAICPLSNIDNIIYGNCIEDFISCCQSLGDCKIYFHNLAFDGYFIMDYILRKGITWVESSTDLLPYTFTTLISDMNQVYAIEVMFEDSTVTFWDSFKVVPISIAAEAKAFNMPLSKGELDYDTLREIGHVLTEEEKEYIRLDVQIDATALNYCRENYMDKMTVGACALSYYKSLLGGQKGFRKYFPSVSKDIDAFLRKAYRGGFVYVNPCYAGKILGEGKSFDVNSLYPSVMYGSFGEHLPYGTPLQFNGEPKNTKKYKLWIAKVRLSFKLKDGRIPCLQLKNNLSFIPTEYVTDSLGEVVITITSVDWDLVNKMYDVTVYEWLGGYAFKSSTRLFRKYIDYWINIKGQATIDNNVGLRTIAKFMLNSLYGKFATKREVKSRKPIIEDDILRYRDLEPEERDGVYLPVACFVTAYARKRTIEAAYLCGDRYIYSDTDSIKILGTEEIKGLPVDDVKLGFWKDEGTFKRFKALRAKTYMAEYESGIEVHVAGLPKYCHSQVSFDNFIIGATYKGKLYQHKVKGGIVLQGGEFKIQ